MMFLSWNKLINIGKNPNSAEVTVMISSHNWSLSTEHNNRLFLAKTFEIIFNIMLDNVRTDSKQGLVQDYSQRL